MERTPYLAALSGLASTSTFTNLTSSSCLAASSTTGAIWRQGGHQVAQKSTTTGLSELMTSSWKVASVTARALDILFSLYVRAVSSLVEIERIVGVNPRIVS